MVFSRGFEHTIMYSPDVNGGQSNSSRITLETVANFEAQTGMHTLSQFFDSYQASNSALSVLLVAARQDLSPQSSPEAWNKINSEKVGLQIRSLDKMEDLSLQDKFSMLTFVIWEDVIQTLGTRHSNVTNYLLSDILGVEGSTINSCMRNIQGPLVERTARFSRWINRMMELKDAKPLSEIEEKYTEFRHWVYETVTNENNNLLLWKDLASLMPPEFPKKGAKPTKVGERLWRTATYLADNGYLPTSTKLRIELKDVTLFKNVTEYAQLPGNKTRRITYQELADALGIAHTNTVQGIIDRMRERNISIPKNIGTKRGPKKERAEKIAIIQHVINSLVEKNGGKTPDNATIQNALNELGRPDIIIGKYVTGKYKRLLNYPARIRRITDQNKQDVLSYISQGLKTRRISQLTGLSESAIRIIKRQNRNDE